MRRSFVFVILSIFSYCVLHNSECIAQYTVFQKRYHAFYDFGVGNSIIPTLDNGFVVSGSTNYVQYGQYDVYILKVDSNGTPQWSRTYAINNETESSNIILSTVDHGFIIGGVFRDFPGNINQRIFLTKVDSTGIPQWIKAYGTMYDDAISSLILTSDGGYLLSANMSYNTTVNVFYLMKLDSIGNIEWTKTYDPGFVLVGKVFSTTDGGYMIGGSTGVGGNLDGCLIKIDTMGGIQWAKKYGGIDDDLTTGFQTIDGGFVLLGSTWSFGMGDNDFFLLKTDSIGNLLWSKTYGNSGYDYGGVACQIGNGFAMIGGGGAALADFNIIKIDSVGNEEWNAYYGGGTWTRYSRGVAWAKDGGIILSGTRNSTFNDADIFFVKTDPIGYTGCAETLWWLTETSPPTFDSVLTLSTSGIIVSSYSPVLIDSFFQVTEFTTCLGVSDGFNKLQTDLPISIFPNPFTTSVTINFSQKQIDGHIRIFDSLGSMVYQKKIAKIIEVLNLEELPQGIYILNVNSENMCYKQMIIK